MKFNIDVIKLIKNEVLKLFSDNYTFKYLSQKYSIDTIIEGIIYVLKTGISWNNYIGGVKGMTLYFHYKRFVSANIFKNVYTEALRNYTKVNNNSLKCQLLDSTFIFNINGSHKIARNALFKNKKLCKISAITDKNGIPLSLILMDGNRHDSTAFNDNIEHILINKNKQKYFLADSAYDTKHIRQSLTDLNYIPIIDYNRRNTKQDNKINKFTNKERRLYKTRIKIENYFCNLKKYKRLLFRMDRYEQPFMSFVYLASLHILMRKSNVIT